MSIVVSLRGEALYINSIYHCRYEAQNGCEGLPDGEFQITASLSHAHGKVLPQVHGLGWIGTDAKCVITLGRVLGRNGLIPCEDCLSLLLRRVTEAEGHGTKVTLLV